MGGSENSFAKAAQGGVTGAVAGAAFGATKVAWEPSDKLFARSRKEVAVWTWRPTQPEQLASACTLLQGWLRHSAVAGRRRACCGLRMGLS